MGRKRLRDFDLPPRMYKRGERYYYVTHEGRWIPLGKDLEAARRKWADLECCGCSGSVADLCERYVADCMATSAASTRKQYKAFAKRIRLEWGQIPADLLTPPQIARWRDSGVGKGWANGVLSLLRSAYAKGVEWGWSATNPARDVAFNVMGIRDRYLTDDEFKAIREAGPQWMRSAMDLAYLTALRPSDLLALRWEQVGIGITNRTRKTNVWQAFTITDEVREVLEEARRRPILGLYVIATDKGQPITLHHWQDTWRTIVRKLGIEDAQIRDIRKKAATDAEREGIDYQALLGHTDRKMSERYIAGTRVIKAQPLRKRI
jgi:integrase